VPRGGVVNARQARPMAGSKRSGEHWRRRARRQHQERDGAAPGSGSATL